MQADSVISKLNIEDLEGHYQMVMNMGVQARGGSSFLISGPLHNLFQIYRQHLWASLASHLPGEEHSQHDCTPAQESGISELQGCRGMWPVAAVGSTQVRLACVHTKTWVGDF